MSAELIARLRASAEEWWECCNDIHIPITEAADALEAAEAELAENEGVIQLLRRQRDAAEAENARLRAELAGITMHTVAQLEEELTAAEAKLAKIDALVARIKQHFMANGRVASVAAFMVANELARIIHPDTEGDET